MSYNVDEFYRDIEHRLAWDMVKPEHKTAPLHDADDAWDCACWTTPDHAAVPCPAPPTERVCIPRALRCACTDAHHYRGSALCPLTPADPWGVDGGAA